MSLRAWFQEYRLRRSHEERPLEFGDPTRVERFQIAARVKAAGQGALIEAATPDFNFELEGGAFMFSKKALALAFRFAQNNISSPGVLRELQGSKVIGTISDALSPNGLAGRIAATGDSRIHFMNVTAGAFFFPLALALHWKSLDGPADARRSIESPLLAHLDFPTREIFLPLNADRCVEAANLARCAFLATIYHEFCHIIRGHTAWLTAEYKQEDFLEVVSDGVSGPDDYSKWRRILETDADLLSGTYLSAFVARAAEREQRSGASASDALAKHASLMLTGVTLMYSWFARSTWYHSGLVRVHVVLIGLMHGLRDLDKGNRLLVKLVPQVEQIQKRLVELELLPESAADFLDGDAYDMAHHTLLKIEESDTLWTVHSPIATRRRVGV